MTHGTTLRNRSTFFSTNPRTAPSTSSYTAPRVDWGAPLPRTVCAGRPHPAAPCVLSRPTVDEIGVIRSNSEVFVDVR